jgi:quinol monooxygenase YgiN
MVRFGLWVELVARAGRERDVAAFLVDALPAVQREAGTVCWFGLRLDHATFAIFDAFESEQARDIHLAGAVAEALADRAGDLFVRPPAIRNVDVLAAKLAAR